MICTTRRSIPFITFALLACIFAAGCGGPTLYPVEGELVVDEKPLAKGAVVLWPDAGKGNTFTGQPTGEVENGKFKVMTQGRVGAPVGWYKITVTSSDIPDSSKPDAAKNPIGPNFREEAKTTLRFEVVASPASGAYNLKATSK